MTIVLLVAVLLLLLWACSRLWALGLQLLALSMQVDTVRSQVEDTRQRLTALDKELRGVE